jgi:hypothetical protein
MAAQSIKSNTSAAAPPAPQYFIKPLITLAPTSTPATSLQEVWLVCQTHPPLWTNSINGYTTISRDTIIENLTHICCACPSQEIAIREFQVAANAYSNHISIVNIPKMSTPGDGDPLDEVIFFQDVGGVMSTQLEDFLSRFYVFGPVHVIR